MTFEKYYRTVGMSVIRQVREQGVECENIPTFPPEYEVEKYWRADDLPEKCASDWIDFYIAN